MSSADIYVGVGFDTSDVITAQIALPNAKYPESADRTRLFEHLVEKVQAETSVATASAITFMPLAGTGSATSFWVNDRPIPPDGETPVADLRWVHRDYHQALGVPLLAGRYFGPQDGEGTPLSVIVNEWAAQHLWPAETPIGKTISMPWGDTLLAQVVGVVGDVRHDGPKSTVRTQLYWEHRQFQPWNQMTIFARSEADATSLASSIRRMVADVDPNVPLYNIRTVDSNLSAKLAQARLSMLALGLFAIIALVLASVGIYGVISYAVSERTRDIGTRMALGASAEAVAGQVIGSGAKLIAMAVLIGLAASLALSRLLQSMVFEVSTSDPTTTVAVSLLLMAVALAACYFPARRAGKTDVVEALRRE